MLTFDYKTGKVISIGGDDDGLMGVTEAAKFLGVHPKTLQIWSRKGVVPVAGKTFGGQRRYSKDQLVEWLQRESA